MTMALQVGGGVCVGRWRRPKGVAEGVAEGDMQRGGKENAKGVGM